MIVNDQDQEEDEEEMLKKALELSQKVPQQQQINNSIEEITTLAY